jgi:formylglycine-generating enzyme required for sulfatase activity/class 3 adenylate cyclase
MNQPDPTRGRIHQLRGSFDGGVHQFDGPVRRLAAIVAGDIAGYSRLMGMDEEGTHARVMRQRRELIEPNIAEHHGKLVKYTGDGFLAMFESPVEAVRCAIVIQQSMVGRNASLPKPQWILYRIGVHLGDVIIEPDDIYGDGVNIAARLESIAEPGHLFISGGVYEQIKNKLVCGYQPLGDRHVKNITDPVNVYRVLPDPAAIMRARTTPWLFVAALGALSIGIFGIGAGAGLYWLVQPKQAGTQTPTAAPMTQAARAPSPSQQQAAAQDKSQAIPAPAQPHVAAPSPAPAAVPATVPALIQKLVETPKVAAPAAAIAPVMVPVIPAMTSLPGGTFLMGSNDDPSERPMHHVTVKPFAISKAPITVREWNACVVMKACTYVPTGDDDAPVTNLSWNDTQQYVRWLSRVAEKAFRLPTEAEWEYAARGGTSSKYWWGDQLQIGAANCKGCNEPYDSARPLKVSSLKPNPFGLYAMGGSVHQWVEDCWHKNYQGAPATGSAWIDGDCQTHVMRSGSWRNDPSYVRPSSRDNYDTNVRYPTHGFRVAQSL